MASVPNPQPDRVLQDEVKTNATAKSKKEIIVKNGVIHVKDFESIWTDAEFLKTKSLILPSKKFRIFKIHFFSEIFYVQTPKIKCIMIHQERKEQNLRIGYLLPDGSTCMGGKCCGSKLVEFSKYRIVKYGGFICVIMN